MPTKKPRLYVTLEPEVHKALKELQEATGASSSSFVAGILQESLPMIKGITKAARLAKDRNLDAFELLQEQLMEATNKASQMNLDIQREKKIRRAKGYQSDDNG